MNNQWAQVLQDWSTPTIVKSKKPEPRTEKFCKGCDRTRPLTEFYVQKGKVSARCKPCHIKHQNEREARLRQERRRAQDARREAERALALSQ